jgi:hypothetical protein
MTRFIHGFSIDNFRGDTYGGLTAAVVALPLAPGEAVTRAQDDDFVILCGMSEAVEKVIRRIGVDKLLPENHITET